MTTTFRPTSRTSLPRLVLLAVAAAALLVSLAAPIWLYSPAQPQAQIPEMHLSFSDLDAATTQSPSALQGAYFGWLGWFLALAAIAMGVVTVLIRRRVAGAVEAVVGGVALILTVFAVKGPLTWGSFFDSIPNIRLGGYLVIIGYLLIIAHGSLVACAGRD